MAEIPVTSTFQTILMKFSPELKETVKVHDILPLIRLLWGKYDPDIDRIIDTIIVQHSNEEGIHKLIQIAGSNESYFVSFIKALQRLDEKCDCGYIANKILIETYTVDQNIYEIFCSANPETQPKNPQQYLNVSPIENHTSAENGVSGGRSDEQSRENEVVSERLKSEDHRAGTKKDFMKVYAGTEIDALENGIFTLLVNELNVEQRWVSLCNQFRLPRKDVRSFENSTNPSKVFLDFIGGYTVSHLSQCLQAASLTDILQKIPVEIIPESSDMKLRSLDNETFSKLSEELNKDRKWEKLANVLRVKRKDVLKLERKDDPAKFLLDSYRHIEVDKLYELLRKIDVTSMIERHSSSENQYNRSEETTALYQQTAGSNERIITTQEANPSYPQAATHERNDTSESETSISTHRQTFRSDGQLFHRSENGYTSGQHSGRATECSAFHHSTGGCNENDLDRSMVRPLEIQERNIEESLMQNCTNVTRNFEETYEKSIFDESTSNHNRAHLTAHESESNIENVNDGQTMQAHGDNVNHLDKSVQVNFGHDESVTRTCRLNNVLTSPENEHASDKNTEQACNALLNDAYAQSRGAGYRDIQNSLPDLCNDRNGQTNNSMRRIVVAPENGSDDCEHPEKAAILLRHSNEGLPAAVENDSVTDDRYQLDNILIANPESESTSIEKSPEQNCEALINDANAQCSGTGYRDIQNSFPSNT